MLLTELNLQNINYLYLFMLQFFAILFTELQCGALQCLRAPSTPPRSFPGTPGRFSSLESTSSACHCVCHGRTPMGHQCWIENCPVLHLNVHGVITLAGSQPILYRAERPFFGSPNANSGWPNPNASEDLQLVPSGASKKGIQKWIHQIMLHGKAKSQRRRLSWTTCGWHLSSLKHLSWNHMAVERSNRMHCPLVVTQW